MRELGKVDLAFSLYCDKCYFYEEILLALVGEARLVRISHDFEDLAGEKAQLIEDYTSLIL